VSDWPLAASRGRNPDFLKVVLADGTAWVFRPDRSWKNDYYQSLTRGVKPGTAARERGLFVVSRHTRLNVVKKTIRGTYKGKFGTFQRFSEAADAKQQTSSRQVAMAGQFYDWRSLVELAVFDFIVAQEDGKPEQHHVEEISTASSKPARRKGVTFDGELCFLPNGRAVSGSIRRVQEEVRLGHRTLDFPKLEAQLRRVNIAHFRKDLLAAGLTDSEAQECIGRLELLRAYGIERVLMEHSNCDF
jgi:hypothetical protein